ncbi:ArsA family ATPase [Pseudobdellovibrio exovorus]|uniref:arsenite-transporting ATPase n=1 Tax=Pseudobdellovibrio exovorus JSS TaxID=1184267 RepID=M4VMU0_9BACT|nr:ArsA-related P-loop ATPase [Pseudobdellovibrio exovorus]AGH94404.1 adventurous gliding motility protein R [Pseudobdellovibrio exovorus JSS]
MMQLRPQTKTLICIGSGGVGKTTMSAALATGLAFEGKKILVLTIDPSQRLAQALGIRTDGEIEQVKLPAKAKGELWSCVINHKKTFEWFLKNASGEAHESVEKILQNRLYQQLSGRLSGSQEFTSLISLYRFVSSKEYDLVILDTPPSQHTWSFLKAPEKISALFNEGVASWFRKAADNDSRGVFKKLMNVGTTQVIKALEMMTGSQFMKELSAFFQAIQKWQGPLESYIMNCHRLLVSPDTEFIMVTSLDSSRLVEAQKLSREILKQGYRLTSVVINRVPVWTQETSAITSDHLKEIAKYYAQIEQDLTAHLGQMKKNLKVYKCPERSLKSEDVDALKQTYDSLQSL